MNIDGLGEDSEKRAISVRDRVARMSAKAALYIAVRETGISKSELARRLGVDEKEIRRMLSPRHQTKLLRIEQALSALGYQLSVSLLKAA